MMQNEQSLFQLSLDDEAVFQCKEISKWAKFLGIIGFVILGLLIVMSIGITFYFTRFAGFSSILGLIYLGFVGIYIYPVLALFRFGKWMKTALTNADQVLFNKSLKSLKNCFLYIGIVTIILICIYGILALVGLITAASSFN